MFKKIAGMVSALVMAALAVLPARAQVFGVPFISPFSPLNFTSCFASGFMATSAFSSVGFGFSPFFSPFLSPFLFGGFSPFFSPFCF